MVATSDHGCILQASTEKTLSKCMGKSEWEGTWDRRKRGSGAALRIKSADTAISPESTPGWGLS